MPEVAAGTGRNLPWYPDGFTLSVIDLSPGMLAVARGPASVLAMDATRGQPALMRVGWSGSPSGTSDLGRKPVVSTSD